MIIAAQIMIYNVKHVQCEFKNALQKLNYRTFLKKTEYKETYQTHTIPLPTLKTGQRKVG